ncbi:MAG: tetratricopeptide repeat protein, partial [Bacteroidia bacterium]
MKTYLSFILLIAYNTLIGSTINYDSLLHQGAQLCEQGQVKQGINLVEEAKTGFEKDENWSMYTQASISYWYAYYQLYGDIDTVLQSFEDLGIMVNSKMPDSIDIAANVNLYHSYFLYYDNQIGESMKASERALHFYEKNRTKNLENISSLYNNLGVLHSEQGNNKKAEDYMLKSIEIKTDFDEQGIPFSEETIVFNFLNLANMYYFAGRYDLFLNYQQKLKDKLSTIKMDPSVELRMIKNYLRYNLRNKKDYKLAKQYLDELQAFEKTFDVDF